MKTSPNAPWTRLAAGALVTGLALTGCGAGSPAAHKPTTAAPTTPAGTTSTAPATASPSPTAPTSAADGANYAVCASRTCEVSISRPVDIRFGGSAPGTLSITKVAPDGVDVDVKLADGGGGSGTLKPGCGTFAFGATGGGSGAFSAPNDNCADPPTAQPGAMTLQMPVMTGGTAIVRIVLG